MTQCVAIITARGGSKRIPEKNIRDFCGKPIIAYSIQAASKSNVFDEVMVSTDDEKIAEISRKYGAVVPFMRSKETANDFATSTDVAREVLSEYEKRGKCFECFCIIYPTAPLLNWEHLRRAKKFLDEGQADSVVTVTEFSFPPLRALVYNNEFLAYKWDENRNKRSQDIEKMYQDAGQFYFCLTNQFYLEQQLILKRTKPIILSGVEVQDIDNETDWHLAEMKYRINKKKHQ